MQAILTPFRAAKRGNNKDTNARTVIKTNLVQVSLLSIALLLAVPTRSWAGSAPKQKRVVITNNHTNYLSIRCYSFDTAYKAQHLKYMQKYTFSFPVRNIFPYATMFNCSTNLGAFVVYRYDDECSRPEYESCDWIYDEERTYHWLPKSEKWEAYDYYPNYESLARGGVIEGYYAN